MTPSCTTSTESTVSCPVRPNRASYSNSTAFAKRSVSRHILKRPFGDVLSAQSRTITSSPKLTQWSSGSTACHRVGRQFTAACSSCTDSINLRRSDVLGERAFLGRPSLYGIIKRITRAPIFPPPKILGHVSHFSGISKMPLLLTRNKKEERKWVHACSYSCCALNPLPLQNFLLQLQINNVGRRMGRFKPARYNRGTVLFWRPLIGPRLV